MPVPMIETQDIEVLRSQFCAWMAGVHGRFCGMAIHENPHEPRTASGDAWENGWEVVNEQLRHSSSSEHLNGRDTK